MPPLPPVTNGAQLVVKYSQFGQEAISVLGGYWTEAPFVSTAEAQRWLNAWWAAIRPSVMSVVTCTGAELRDLTISPGAVAVAAAPPSPTGGLTSGSAAIAAASYVVKWTTAQAGRRARGRTFVPGFPEAYVDDGGRDVLGTARDTLTTNLNTLYRGAMGSEAGNIVPAVISRVDAQARQITGVSVAPIVGIQRRRMR